MSDSSKAFAILTGIFSFYVLLSVIESIECSNLTAKFQSTPATNATKLPKQPLFDRKGEEDEENKTLLEFLDHPRTKALRELHEMSFVGEWDVSNIQGYQLFETFVDLQKKIRMKFINEVGYWHNYQGPRKTGLQLYIIDGEYSDDRQYALKLNDTIFEAFDIARLSYSFINKPVNVSEMDQLDVQNVKECMVTLKMDLSEIIRDDDFSESKYRIVEGGRIDIKISSPDCNIFIQASVYKDTTDYDKKTINYSLLLTFMAIINLYSIAKMIKSCVEAPAEANKISLVSIGFITVWDTYICFSHLYLALSMESLFHFFIMPAFWYFILFSIFEVKLLMIIWKARYYDSHQDLQIMGRAKVAFYFKLYLTIFASLFIFYKFIRYNEFLICMSLYLAPQIIHNILRGGRIRFNENYMVFVIGIRGLLPLYFRGCVHNLYHLRPSFTFCCTFLLVIGVQILLIFYQCSYGAKFFIPSRFLPQQFNYLYELPEDIESGADQVDECVVCMGPLTKEPSMDHSSSLHIKMIMSRLKLKKGQIMKTPCNHKFHVMCLVGWMSIKLECPTCRSKLPVLECAIFVGRNTDNYLTSRGEPAIYLFQIPKQKKKDFNKDEVK